MVARSTIRAGPRTLSRNLAAHLRFHGPGRGAGSPASRQGRSGRGTSVEMAETESPDRIIKSLSRGVCRGQSICSAALAGRFLTRSETESPDPMIKLFSPRATPAKPFVPLRSKETFHAVRHLECDC